MSNIAQLNFVYRGRYATQSVKEALPISQLARGSWPPRSVPRLQLYKSSSRTRLHTPFHPTCRFASARGRGPARRPCTPTEIQLLRHLVAVVL